MSSVHISYILQLVFGLIKLKRDAIPTGNMENINEILQLTGNNLYPDGIISQSVL